MRAIECRTLTMHEIDRSAVWTQTDNGTARRLPTADSTTETSLFIYQNILLAAVLSTALGTYTYCVYAKQ